MMLIYFFKAFSVKFKKRAAFGTFRYMSDSFGAKSQAPEIPRDEVADLFLKNLQATEQKTLENSSQAMQLLPF